MVLPAVVVAHEGSSDITHLDRPFPSPPRDEQPLSSMPAANIRTRPIPGVRCPTCLANGQEVWVIPGKICHECGTECN